MQHAIHYNTASCTCGMWDTGCTIEWNCPSWLDYLCTWVYNKTSYYYCWALAGSSIFGESSQESWQGSKGKLFQYTSTPLPSHPSKWRDTFRADTMWWACGLWLNYIAVSRPGSWTPGSYIKEMQALKGFLQQQLLWTFYHYAGEKSQWRVHRCALRVRLNSCDTRSKDTALD